VFWVVVAIVVLKFNFNNRYLLVAIAGELAIATVFVFVAPCQALLGTAVPPARDMVLLIPSRSPFGVPTSSASGSSGPGPRGARRPSHQHPPLDIRQDQQRIRIAESTVGLRGQCPMAACSSGRRAAGCVAISDIVSGGATH